MTSALSGLSGPIVAYLEDPALSAFWQAVRRSLERTGGELSGSVTVELDDHAARLVGGLLGVQLRPGRRRLSLATLDEKLRTSAARRGVVQVVAAVTGSPLRDRPTERAVRTAEWDAVWDAVDRLLVEHDLASSAWTGPWLAWLHRGVLTRAGASAAADALRTAVPAVATLLTAARTDGVAPRQVGELATAVAGDAHALDGDRLAGAVVLRALSAAFDVAPPGTSAERRAMWAYAGVVTDEVSGTVLAWNLRPPGPDRWSAMMRERAELGLVTPLTTAELRRAGVEALHDDDVYAVENPQVLQAATTAHASAALLCFSGNLSVAGGLVARALGPRLHYHGDFDWPGVAIAGRVVAAGARPWRLAGADYVDAVRSTRAALPLTGRSVSTPWDPTLAEQMSRTGFAVHEEALTATLLGDLG